MCQQAASKPPEELPTHRVCRFVGLITLMIRAYQLTLSPFLGPRCRFLPTCSEYAAEAFSCHGAWGGLRLSLRRIARCHPWGGSGYDPVPPGAN